MYVTRVYIEELMIRVLTVIELNTLKNIFVTWPSSWKLISLNNKTLLTAYSKMK